MPVSGITSTRFDFALLLQGDKPRQAAVANGFGADAGQGLADFMSTLKSRIAEFQSQALGTLFSDSTESGMARDSSNFTVLFGADDGLSRLFYSLSGHADGANGLAASGRNTALADPESAYRMMTLINGKDVAFKAEFAEMDEMKSYLATMRREALALKDIDAAAGNDDIRAHLQGFADAYNGWIGRFDADLHAGGLLAGTQAAQVAQWELEQAVEGIYNGAMGGLHAMADLGFDIDPVSNLVSLDGKRLDAALANDKARVIGTVRELSEKVAEAATLLSSGGNFIANRMDNLARAIDYLDTNTPSFQAEFGLGAAPRPSDQLVKALAGYNAIHSMVG